MRVSVTSHRPFPAAGTRQRNPPRLSPTPAPFKSPPLSSAPVSGDSGLPFGTGAGASTGSVKRGDTFRSQALSPEAEGNKHARAAWERGYRVVPEVFIATCRQAAAARGRGAQGGLGGAPSVAGAGGIIRWSAISPPARPPLRPQLAQCRRGCPGSSTSRAAEGAGLEGSRAAVSHRCLGSDCCTVPGRALPQSFKNVVPMEVPFVMIHALAPAFCRGKGCRCRRGFCARGRLSVAWLPAERHHRRPALPRRE